MNSGQFGAQLRNAGALIGAGDLDSAERQLRGALEESPDRAEALYLLAQCARLRAREAEYESLLQRVVALAMHPQASLELAQQLLSRGEIDAAEEHVRGAVAFLPRNPLAHRIMGFVFLKSGRPAAAEFHFRRIIDLAGERPRVCALLADALKLQGKLDESEEWFAKAAALDPENAELWTGWCRMAEARRRLPQAWEKLEHAEAIAPASPNVCLARAVLFAREGRKSEAEQSLNEGLVGHPENAGLYFERGRIRKEAGRYDDAWADFVEANRISREHDGLTYGKAHVDQLFARLKLLFTRERMAVLPRAGERTATPQPIFILGFPRSGTTLIEQILAQHPLVRAGDELEFVAQVAAIAPRWIGSRRSYPECLAELAVGDNLHLADRLRDAYFDRAAQAGLVSPECRFFTDKMPLNELHLGLIAILFPAAPLIIVRRHPLDVVCSNFALHIRHGFNQSFDVSTSARHVAAMEDLVAHYRREIDLNLHDIRYEDVVADPEREIRRLLGFAGLAFDPRCLCFEESERVPRTISYAQVGEKLHGRSVSAYRNFRKHLSEAIDILEPVIARLGYTID